MKFLSENQVKKAIIIYLEKKSYMRNKDIKPLHSPGADIEVYHKGYSRKYIIEAKGDSKSKNARSIRDSNFVHAIGQIMTRIIPDAGYMYAIALPASYSNLVFSDRLGWKTMQKMKNLIGKKGPSGLHFLLVYPNRRVKKITYKAVKNAQGEINND